MIGVWLEKEIDFEVVRILSEEGKKVQPVYLFSNPLNYSFYDLNDNFENCNEPIVITNFSDKKEIQKILFETGIIKEIYEE